MANKQQGVYQDSETGKWTWTDQATKQSGEQYESREEARVAYLKHLQSNPASMAVTSKKPKAQDEAQEEEDDADDEETGAEGSEESDPDDVPNGDDEEKEPEPAREVKRGKKAKKSSTKKTTKAVQPSEEEPVASKNKSTKKAKSNGRANGPVGKARAIFAKMPKARRKDVIAACVKAGINENTAKTYYQKWRSEK